jgi:hypothetical protein
MTTNDPANTAALALRYTNFPTVIAAIRNDAVTLFAVLSGRVSQFTRSVGLDENSGTRTRVRSIANVSGNLLFAQDSGR